MDWIYQGKPFVDTPADYFGFIYEIYCPILNKKYIGRKYFTSSKTRQVNKKKKKTRVDSDWREYFGSNAALLIEVERLGKLAFERKILRLCRSRGECSYFETKTIFELDCLLKDEYWNGWVQCKIRRSHVKDLVNESFVDRSGSNPTS